MLQAILIGHLGADAEVKNANGREFVAFRIAHSEKWTDENGQVTEKTIWVDCIINGKPNVLPYLKKGQCVSIIGSVSLRVYSSAKDKCFKAGMTINAMRVELIGGRGDDVPSSLFSEDGQTEIRPQKYFFAPGMTRDMTGPEKVTLVSKSGEKFFVDRPGWVQKAESSEG